MKTINKIVSGLIGIVVLPFIVRSCSIAQSNRPYMQGEYKGTHYSFAHNGPLGQTYKITLKDGTKLRCDDLSFYSSYSNSNIIDSVIEYNKEGKISKIYKNKILDQYDENDEFLTKLKAQVKEARNFIKNYKEQQRKNEEQQRKNEQSELLNKIKGVK